MHTHTHHTCREHLGMLDEQRQRVQSMVTVEGGPQEDVPIEDPACERFYKTWCSIAARNMDIFEKVT